MSKGNIIAGIVFLVLGVIGTYVAALIEILISGQVMSGDVGFPFKYGFSSFFGGSSVNQTVFVVDIIFWAAVLFGIWKLILKVAKK